MVQIDELGGVDRALFSPLPEEFKLDFKTAPAGMCRSEAGSKAVASAVPANLVPPPAKTAYYHGVVVTLAPDAPAYCWQGGVDPRDIPSCVGAQAAHEAYERMHRTPAN